MFSARICFLSLPGTPLTPLEHFTDLNYRLMLPDADVRSLLGDEQLREENVELLRRFDKVMGLR